MSQSNQLFGKKTIEKFCSDIKITTKQKKAVKEWLDLLNENKLRDEKKNYLKFSRIILEDILGYPVKNIDHESGNVEFQFANDSGKNVMCIEAKGTDTKDLFALQHRAKKEHATPIKQTWDYMGNLDLEYGICTNYKDFVLITKSRGYSKYFFFDFTKTKNEDKLKEFIGIFSKSRIIDEGFVEKLYDESIMEEKEFTKEFYKLYHETRLMLVKAFSEKQNVSKESAIHYSQLFLNRLIFMFFVSDSGDIPNRLFTEQMHKVLNSDLVNEHSKLAFDQIINLFRMMNKGSHKPKIFGYNGGLFADEIPNEVYFKDIHNPKLFSDIQKYSKLKKSVKLDEYSEKIIKKYGSRLSPLISNLLIMDSFDFTTDVNVNILGHIFEQSISDLEELSGNETSKRKKEGVYYTPEYITEYICRNTIIPYLSKSGKTTDSQELVAEYSDDIELLEKKFKEIKILDPACGSGAFLVKAVDILLEINKAIQDYKQLEGKYSTGDQFSLTRWNEETEVRAIIENNTYGVDINEESVGITRLAMFLKIASANRKLMSLSNNIKVGNSLIDDKTVDPKAFDWKEEFPEILSPLIENRGFDVVIGNPPYVKSRDQAISEKIKNAIEKKFTTAYSMWDLYVPFMELGLSLLKSEGNFAMIIKDTLGEVNYTIKLIEHIEKKYYLYQIDFFSEIEIFEDVGVKNKITFIRNTKKKKQTQRILHHPSISDINRLEVVDGVKKYAQKTAKFSIDTENTLSLGDICFTSYGLRLNSDKADKQFKFKKQDLISNNKSAINNRIYTEGKFLEEFVITKELFVEWETDRCPKRLVRPTFPELYEPKKILMSRQKRIAAYSDQKHICDNTVIMGILAKDLAGVDNSNIRKYYKNLETSRQEIENNSKDFKLKYILAILNSNLIKYFLKYNSGGKIDSYPDDWKKIPIKKISKTKQIPIERKAETLIVLNIKLQTGRSRFLDRLKTEFKLNKIPKVLKDFYELTDKSFIYVLENDLKIKLGLKEKDEWQDYFEQYKTDLINLKSEIDKTDSEINQIVYKLYGLTDDEIKLVEESL